MDKRKLSLFIVIILFVVMAVVKEIKDYNEVVTLESAMEEEDQEELKEGDIEIFGTPKTDYLLEKFEFVFESEEVKNIFEEAEAMEHFKYEFYDLLYSKDKGEYTTATVLEDHGEDDRYINCTVMVDENIVVNVTYDYIMDEFRFGFHEIVERGRTNAYVEVEE